MTNITTIPLNEISPPGVKRIDKAMMTLWGTRLPVVMSFLWRFSCPVLLLAVFGYSLYSYRPPRFEDYDFPPWATLLGWLISLASLLPTPLFLVWSVYKAPGDSFREKVKVAFRARKRWETMDIDVDSEESEETPDETLMETKAKTMQT